MAVNLKTKRDPRVKRVVLFFQSAVRERTLEKGNDHKRKAGGRTPVNVADECPCGRAKRSQILPPQPLKQKSHLYGGFFVLYVLQGVEPTKKKASGSSLKLGQSKKVIKKSFLNLFFIINKLSI